MLEAFIESLPIDSVAAVAQSVQKTDNKGYYDSSVRQPEMLVDRTASYGWDGEREGACI